MGPLHLSTMFRALLRRLYRVILTEEVRHSLTSLALLKLLFLLRRHHLATELITDFAASHVLVLAPHMDDEVLGCGGTLGLHVRSGAAITVVYMTDGRKGDPDLYGHGFSPAVIAEKELALCATRREEAASAAQILGIQEQIFLDNPDGQLAPLPEVVERVRNILAERWPTVVYHPSLFDLHPDHWATNRVLYASAKGLSWAKDWHPVYRGYEVWTPVLANRIADISAVITMKKDAMAQFKSQISHTDFVRTLLGLNAYRSLYHSHGRGYAEAFDEKPPDLYNVLFQRLSVDSK